MSRLAPSARRRFITGSAIGGGLAFAVFAVVLTTTGAHADLLRRDGFGNFFDAQAEALLHARWNVAPKELAIEGFHIGRKTYTYFGVFPSLLRMPVLAVSHSLYGRLTQLSMLLAFGVAVASLAALWWRIRELVRPGRPCGVVLPAVVVFALGCGTATFFLASRPIVYHEAILWGVAWSVLAYERVLALLARPSMRTLGAGCVCATLAFLSRGSVGLGPVVALGIVVLGQILRVVAPHLGRGVRALTRRLDWIGADADPPGHAGRWLAACVIGAAIPVVAYAYVNFARFDSPTNIPWSKQIFVVLSPQNRRVLKHNHNTYFGLKFAPTTMLQYARPDAILTEGLFPWVTFPHARAAVVGNVDLVERAVSTSVPASMPALVLLGAVGGFAALWPRFARAREVARLRGLLLASAIAIVPVITVAYVGNRYLGDFVPLLLLGGLTGFETLLRRREDRPTRRSASVLLVIVTVLAAFGVWVNVTLAVVYQRLYNPEVASERAGMLALQYGLDRRIGGRPHDVAFTDTIPRGSGPGGTTAVVGNCDAMYWSDGVWWWAIEGRPEGGRFHLKVTFPRDLGTTWQPIVAIGDPGKQVVVAARAAGDEVELGLGQVGRGGDLLFVPSAERLTPDRAPHRHDVKILADASLQRVEASVDGKAFLGNPALLSRRLQPYQIGEATTPGVAPRFTGAVKTLPPDLSTCKGILSRRHG